MTDAVAGGKTRQAADLDHHVEQRHIVAIGQRPGLGRLADHADLLAEGADELRDDDRDDRILHIGAQLFLDLARERRRGLAGGDDVLDQRDRDLAVRPDRNMGGEIGVAPDEDVEIVAGTDEIIVGARIARHRRVQEAGIGPFRDRIGRRKRGRRGRGIRHRPQLGERPVRARRGGFWLRLKPGERRKVRRLERRVQIAEAAAACQQQQQGTSDGARDETRQQSYSLKRCFDHP